MSQKIMKQTFILSRLVQDPTFTVAEAAEAMELSERQIKRLKKAFKEKGADALVHKNIGRAPANALDEGTTTIWGKDPLFKSLRNTYQRRDQECQDETITQKTS